MAVARKGTRKITVDGKVFVWKLTFNWEEFEQLMLVTVELLASPASKLLVYPIRLSVNFVDFNRGEPITPKTVESFIRQGLSKGWQPQVRGPAFVLGRKSVKKP